MGESDYLGNIMGDSDYFGNIMGESDYVGNFMGESHYVGNTVRVSETGARAVFLHTIAAECCTYPIVPIRN